MERKEGGRNKGTKDGRDRTKKGSGWRLKEIKGEEEEYRNE